MKPGIFVLIMVIITVFVLVAFNSKTSMNAEHLKERAALVVRQIGHKLLHRAGDSASLVMPVKQLSDAVFLLEFQNSFSFTPDTLVEIVQRELLAAELPQNYIVNVSECSTREIVYGFSVNPSGNDIIPCLGRVQPKACYTIHIAFRDFKENINSRMLLLLSGITTVTGVAFIVYIRRLSRKDKKDIPQTANENLTPIGKYLFDEEQKKIKFMAEIIALSDKESKLLGMFADNPNQLIDRDHLLKEVWENEGVFTGRSLDMFISKLRKKLSKDPSVRIVNIHGRGYKLEIMNETN